MSKTLEKIKSNQDRINTLFEKTQKLISQNNQHFDNNVYFQMEELEHQIKLYHNYIDEFNSLHILLPFLYKKYIKLKDNIKFFKNCTEKEEEYIDDIRRYNDNIIKKDITEIKNIIGSVESKSLDEQQLRCLAKKSNNHLVLAGAGTGKTLTMLAYVKYLLFSGIAKPNEILVLSFTKDSANEINERIVEETGIKIDAQTFHKLGINIITQVEDKKPNITNLTDFFRQYIQKTITKKIQEDKKFFSLIQNYTTNIYGKFENEFSFKTKNEYNEHMNNTPPTSLKGEVLRSYSEVDVANFLYLNGIKYEYETNYKFDTATTEYSQYKPDFYLPQYDIYIEMFGVDENGDVPPWFSSKEGLTPTETYQEGMRWKRKIHKENNTVLVECFAYQKFNGTLEKTLKQELSKYGVKFFPISNEKVIEQLNQLYEIDTIKYISEQIGTVINLLKGQNISIKELKSRNNDISNMFTKYVNNLMISIVEPIYKIYQNELISKKEIDFNDMINRATKYVQDNSFIHQYRFVIIDEYQDISYNRYNLIKSMKNQNNFKLICVGDDWQSIYQFTGSDIGYIVNFEDYWGLSDISKIEKTYRFQKNISEKANKFILKNKQQKNKKITSGIKKNTAIIRGFEYRNVKEQINIIKKELNQLPENASVFILGRYNDDINFIKKDHEFILHNINKKYKIEYKRKILNIEFMTIHHSKGLEADYVIVLNNNDDIRGFPSKIQNPPIYALLLKSSDTYEYAEERRLFYTAITRTKGDVLLLYDKNKKSEFIKELIREYEDEFCGYRVCKWCGAEMTIRESRRGKFWGCTNYYKANCRYTEKI